MKPLRHAIFKPVDAITDNAPQWAQLVFNRRTAVIAVILLIAWVGYLVVFQNFAIAKWTDWILFNRSLWDWMGLLIIPIVLAIGGFLLQRSERETDRELAEKAQLDKTLDDYIADIKELILKEGLLNTKKEDDDPKRDMVRTLTLITVRRLDSERNRTVFRFLQEIGAMREDDPVVRFAHTDLTGADLRDAPLYHADLGATKLIDANLQDANLTEANLSGSILKRANLERAFLLRANLRGTVLQHANLKDADLTDAILRGTTDLRGADLQGANLTHADLWAARLEYANLKGANLKGVNLTGAIMPDGSKYSADTDISKFGAIGTPAPLPDEEE